MKCPRCAQAMELVENEGIRSATCSACGGAWIGGASLHKLFAREVGAPHIEEALDTFMSLDFRDGRLPCPTCRGRHLKTIEVEGVELDYCIGCKGLFFDPGELEQVFPHTYRTTARKGADSATGAGNLFETIVEFFSRIGR